MTKTSQPKRELTVIEGDLHCKMAYGSLQIVAAPASSPPFRTKAIAFEEDTFLVMSADTTITEPFDHPIILMKKLRKQSLNRSAV